MLPAALFLWAAVSGQAPAQDQQWQGVTAFDIEGKGWTGTANFFDRLPESARDKVSAVAWQQSRESAGLAVRFVTDADAVSVRWSLTSGSLAMPHMPATGCSGVDLYTRAAGQTWRFAGNGRPGKQEGNLATFQFPDGSMARRECLLYLPLYNGTLSLELGVKPGAHLDLVGAYLPTMREADDAAMARGRLFVDTRNGMAGAGDLIQPVTAGVIGWDRVLGDLFDLAQGRVAGRQTADEITIFKNVGGAHLDLFTASGLLHGAGRG